MFTEMIATVVEKAKDFDSSLVRIKTLNDQLITRSEKLLCEMSCLLEKVKGKDVKKCSICFTRPVTQVFVNCGHTVCVECAERCKNGRARCFTCRKPVLDVIRVYF